MTRSTLQARLVVDELVRCGITDAVLCPGSRNAPLSFALHAADAAGRLRLHVRIDERTAGFLALGLALRSGRPVPVATTSGTAVANLHPAVLEASHAGVALLALTADRPPAAIGTGANQTIVQPGIFGGAVRLAVAGLADADPGLIRSAVDRAVAAATGRLGGPPGPVQLNLPFTEPLVPDRVRPGRRPVGTAAGRGPRCRRRPARCPRCRSTRSPRPSSWPAPAPAGADRFDGVPVVAEPSAGCWPSALRTGPWLLEAPGLRPAQVVVAGRPTLHRPVQRLLADPDVAVYALADPAGRSWPDVAGTVRAVGSWPTLGPGPGLARRAGGGPTRRPGGCWTGSSTTRARRPACGWPGPCWRPCPRAPSSCWVPRTRCATCRWPRSRGRA